MSDYPFELREYPFKDYVDKCTPRPDGIKDMEFIEFGFVNIDEIEEINKGKVQDNYGRLGDNITANDLEPIVSIYQNGEYKFAAYEPPVICHPSGVCPNERGSGEHRFKGKRLTPLVDISNEAEYGSKWLFVAICRFDTLEALRDYSFKENNKSLSFVKRFSSKESSIANIVKYLNTIDPKRHNKTTVLAKLKEVSWDGCEEDGIYVEYTSEKKEDFAKLCLSKVGVKYDHKKRYNRNEVISELIDDGYIGVTKKHPAEDPNTYVGSFAGKVSPTGFDPNFIRATEFLILKILKGEDVRIIAYVDARSKDAADMIRKEIVDNYFSNIIKTSYGVVALDTETSVEELKKKSEEKLGKVTFYFAQVFDDDPLFTKMECKK